MTVSRASAAQRKIFLVASLTSNIGMLCFFKYFMFAAENLNRMLFYFGKPQVNVLVVLLPAGISFYTFESISYVVDIYLGRAKPASAWVFHTYEKGGRVAHRLLDEACARAAGTQCICLLYHPVSTPRRRADHPLPGFGAAIIRAHSHH